MPKPFGTPIAPDRRLTRAARPEVAVFVATLPAYPLAGWTARSYPTLVPRPFF